MVGKNRFDIACDIIKMMRDDGHVIISLNVLRSYIMKTGGTNENTITQYLKVMKETGLIEDVGSGFEVKNGK